MARLARVMVPGIPYHVTHRGNRRGDVFLEEADRREYVAQWAAAGARFDVKIWGWCLMTNHVHLLVVPLKPCSLAKAVGLVHAATPGGSTPRAAGRATCGPAGSTLHRWTSRTCGGRSAMWN